MVLSVCYRCCNVLSFCWLSVTDIVMCCHVVVCLFQMSLCVVMSLYICVRCCNVLSCCLLSVTVVVIFCHVVGYVLQLEEERNREQKKVKDVEDKSRTYFTKIYQLENMLEALKSENEKLKIQYNRISVSTCHWFILYLLAIQPNIAVPR